jgi:hypothetical protein
MRLIARDGTSLTLHPLGYQLPAGTGPDDDRWLVIGGHLRVGDRSWSFEEPCLLVDEARELGAWLRRAAQGNVRAQALSEPPDREWEPSLRFTKPALAFSVAARDDAGLVVRVHCSLGAAPPWLEEDQRLPWGYAVALRVDPIELQQAATQWTYQLTELPPGRPPTPEPPGLGT